MIDPKLVTLLTVNELNSFTKAAQKLSLTQPAASSMSGSWRRSLGLPFLSAGREISS